MKHGGDGVGENAVGVGVDRFQRFRHGGNFDLFGRVDILVENKADLIFLHLLDLIAAADVALHKAGAGVQLYGGMRVQPALDINGAFYNAALVDLILIQHAEVRRLKQIVPPAAGQRKLLARKGVDITQTHAVKAGGAVDLDELTERLIQTVGKILPVRVAHGGQGDKILGQAELIGVVLGEEGVVVYLLRARTVQTGRLLHLALIARKGLADGLLKVGGFARVDRQNGGEAQLADDFDQLIFAISVAAVVGRDHDAVPPKIFYANYKGNEKECQIARGEGSPLFGVGDLVASFQNAHFC